MEELELTGYPTSKLEPTRIAVTDVKGDLVLMVYCDGYFAFHGRLISPDIIKTALTISQNFWLFYNNIENVNPEK